MPRIERLVGAVWIAGAILTAPGCWITQNAGASADLHRTVSAASLRVAQVEQQLAEKESRIEQLEEVIRVQGQNQATRLENLDQVNVEVARLRGEIEVLRFDLQEIVRLLDDLQIGYERRHLHAEARLRKVEGYLGVAPPPPPTDEELGLTPSAGAGQDPTDSELPGAEGSEPDLGEVPDTAEGKLELAADHMEAGRNGVARAVLRSAMDEHVGASEMAEIRYRLGETWFNDGDWIQAATTFKGVTDNHPKSEWSCWALFRQGECFDKLSQPENARLFYEGAAAGRCSKSDAAKEARSRL